MKAFFIPGNVPSSKNSRQAVQHKQKDGTYKTRFIASKTVQKYRARTNPYWSINKGAFRKAVAELGLTPPLYVGFFFIRDSKRTWDQVNPEQTAQDEMVKHGWIDDDDVLSLCPTPLFIEGEFWKYDKDHSGVIIVLFSSFSEISKNYSATEVLKAIARPADQNFVKHAFIKRSK